MTRYRSLLGLAALAALTVVVGLGVYLGRSPVAPKPSTSSSGAPLASGASPVATPAVALLATTRVTGTFDIALTHEPTAGQAQSKLWFAEGAWWATLIDPATQELHIARLDPTTQSWSDTGAVVDDRPHVRSDALWDGTHLTIVSAGNRPTASQAVRITQFHYDAKAARFAVDPDLPIALTTVGVTDPVLARDSKGVLWLAYVDQTKLILRHSLGNVWHWSPPAPPPIAGATGATGGIRAAALAADGSRLTLVWNGANDDTLQVGQHVDGADPGTWLADSTKVAGLANAPGGLSIRTIAAAGGSRLFVTFETAPDRSTKSNPLAPGAVVMIRDATGVWTNIQLARVKDHFTTPILAIDDQHGTLIAVAFVSNTGTIVYKQSPLDRVSFESGQGTDLIASTSDPNLRNPTSTKQAIDLTAGLIVLGADDATGHYALGRLATSAAPVPSAGPSPSGPSPSGPSPSGPPGSPPPVAAGGPVVLLHDTFSPWVPGTRLPTEWVTTAEGRGTGLVEVIGAPAPNGRSLLVRTSSFLGSIRACTSFAPTGTGITAIQLFLVSAIGGSDTTVVSIRGPGGEAASVRVTRHGLLAFYNGQLKVTTTLLVRPGAWYRTTVVIRPATHAYDLAVANAAGRVIYRIAGVHWRTPAIPAMDTFCTQSPPARGAAVVLDDLEVLR